MKINKCIIKGTKSNKKLQKREDKNRNKSAYEKATTEVTKLIGRGLKTQEAIVLVEFCKISCG